MERNKKTRVFFLQLRRKHIKSAKKMLDFANWICLTVVCKNCIGKKIEEFECAKKSDLKTTLNKHTIFSKENEYYNT